MWYNAPMTNPYDPNTEDDTNDSDLMPYDDSYDVEEMVAELMSEGYTEEEARRMAGEYDYSDEEDEYGYGNDDLDRDIPDFNHGEDE